MPGQVLYMRGFARPPMDRYAASPGVRDDLKAVAGLSDDQVSAVQEQLSDAKGFLAPKSLLALLREAIGDDGPARSLQRAMRNLGPEDIEPLLKALSQPQPDEESPLEEGVVKRLGEILPRLIQAYPALVRFEKAERLAAVTGQRLEGVELICDLRPIFDESRKNIEGMMSYTRLRVVATGADGLSEAFEAELTRQQVCDLAEKASKAVEKLDVLHDAIEKQWVPGGVPDIPLTRPPRKDLGDA